MGWTFLLLTHDRFFFAPFRQSVKVLLCSYHELWSDTAGFQFWFHHLLICQFAKKDILLNARLLLEPLKHLCIFSHIFPSNPATRGWYRWQCTTDSSSSSHSCATSAALATFKLNSLQHQVWANPLVSKSAIFRQLNTKPGQGKELQKWLSECILHWKRKHKILKQ